MVEPLMVISAGRTRDLAGWHPTHLADVLRGRAPARRGPRSPAFFIDLDEVGAVALWTKQPAALLESRPLADLLVELKERRVLVVLQLSVTGLGGSPLEPGIPEPDRVAEILERILEPGLLAGPDCVKLRWDPVARYDLGRGLVLANDREDLFDEVFDRFSRIGAVTWTASVLDLKYQGAANRLREAGIEVVERAPEAYRPFFDAMARRVGDAGGRFSICCHPPLEPWVSGDGCIDGQWINDLRRTYYGENARDVETVKHNVKRRGGQRPRCGCSCSADISYATGFRTCATQHDEGGGGGCCLYCYSWHGRAGSATSKKVAEQLRRLHDEPLPVTGAGPFWHRALERRREAR
jgi:hypothetical protein